MIIKKVVLENWKQIDQLDIDLDHGVNLIHGPNEIGKSSLVEALNYVLLKESSSNKKEVKELMKWGTDLKAKIKVYFKLDEKDYLIHKSFPKGETSLHISTNGDQVKLSEGKTADQKILDLLNIKDIKEKGLLDVFWSHQNSLSSYKFELDQNTKASLSDNIQKNLIQPKTEQFHRGIIESYSKFFTSTGRIKAGSGISENNTQLQKYYDDKNGINNKLNKIVELDQQITDSSKELSQIELAILQHEKDHKNLIDRQSQYNKRKREYESAQKDLSLVEKDLTYLKKEKDKYLGLVKEITDAEKLLGEGENKLKEINSTIDKENTVLQELESQEQKVIEELTQLEGEIQKDKDKADYLDKVIELNSLKEELKEAEQLKENLNELKKERESIVQKMDTIKIPDKKTIEKAEKLLHEIEKEKSILEALQLKVTILPKENINIKLKKDSLEEESQHLAKGEEKDLLADAEMTLDLVDYASIQIKSGKGDLRGQKEKITSLQNRYGDLLNKSEEKAIHILKEQNELKEELNNEADRLKDRISLKSDKFTNTNTLIQHIENIKRNIQQINEKMDDSQVSVDQEINKDFLQQLKEETNEKEKDLTKLGETRYGVIEAKDKKKDELGDLKSNKTKLEGNIEQYKNTITKNKKDIDDILTDKTIDELDNDLKNQSKEIDDLQKHCDELKVDEKDEVTDGDIKKLKDTLNELFHEQDTVKKNKNEANGELKSLRDEDYKALLTRNETEIQSIESKLKQLRTEASAYTLLKTLMDEEKARYSKNITEPLADKLLDNINKLSPITPFKKLSLSSDYQLQDMEVETLSGQGLIVDRDPLSLGMKEQIALLYKLTISEFMASDTFTFPIILDDPLAHTDPQRMKVLLDMITKHSSKYQFIILTCNPNNYSHEGFEAKRIEISS